MRDLTAGLSSKAVILLVFVILLGALVAYKQFPNLFSNKSNNSFSSQNLLITLPTKIQDREVHSADGTLKVILRTKQEKDLTTYSFFTADIAGKNEKLLFTKTLTQDTNMVIPPNSWSPDNKYLFLKEAGSGSLSFFVFKENGASFANGEQYLDVALLFKEHKIPHVLTDVTGWDSPTLLHVTTSSENTQKGPSYWFDVPSKVFLQLARG